MEKGKLYLVPTPIGNLKDMTYRAIEVLQSVYRIYAEDTRTSYYLLSHYKVETPCHSYHKFNEVKRLKEMISFLNSGLSIAIISDAGSPGISDPSNIIVKECIVNDIDVIALPGATALIPAITASGFNSDKFIMIGFLSTKKQLAIQTLTKYANLDLPIVIYESPHRLTETLSLLHEHLGDREIAIARELTKQFETWYRNHISFFIENPDIIKIKGEFVIVINPAIKEKATDEDILDLSNNFSDDIPRKEVASIIAEKLDVSKNYIYNLLISKRKNKYES
ncbi:MAG TPA: 16S rRNA (cytidine(1402)-2'-O)-methyltransferase [Candidatus Cloacimonadota bacterium]|jgi:16S rRNA (cytidine1402-2'-O)-methyltransferase|nr:16S rRNA (cytidine(1402)-2'-O)-methyltransferase [Candidatus Cloacimonadales bacterium]HPY97189.1 16S rRNA (cytidine(1402)-2'-O)-methyltransferase [Candidatus Cloacimonadota bacterium]HQB40394.1 16S rRNA (cytidine(1402)-2'-O)-methyltransferase [Candidatus Cloacimonadota bacterium]